MVERKDTIGLFDLDRTIYNTHTFFGILRRLVEVEFIDQTLEDDILRELNLHKEGKRTYEDAANYMLVRLAEGIKGKPYQELEDIAFKFFQDNKQNFYPYFVECLPEMQKTADVYLVTTNIQAVARAVQRIFGLDGVISTVYEVVDGKFTGSILSTLAGGKHMVSEVVIKYKDSFAVGDSENDIGMFEVVKRPFCINPSEELLPVATSRGWTIINEENASSQILKASI
jgi:HAD superfamily phosphoserine phosphatase-like hydrolase